MTIGNVLNHELTFFKRTVERLEKIISLYKELITVMDFGEVDTLTDEEKQIIIKQYDAEIKRQEKIKLRS